MLVTGCGHGGIGHEYARCFQAAGCRVFATDVPDDDGGTSTSSMAALAALPGVTALPLDVTSDASVAAAVARVLAEAGRIDVLVNNAGVGVMGPVAEVPLAAAARAWEVNVAGLVRVVQAVAPAMAAQAARAGAAYTHALASPRIVNVGSVVGAVATPWAGAYCASKAAVHALTDAMRVELRPLGVQVMLVVPGAVASGFGGAALAAVQRDQERRPYRMYAGYEAAVRERAAASQQQATPAAELARAVVAAALRPSVPRRLRYGRLTGVFAALQCAPLWVRDAFMTAKFMTPATAISAAATNH